MMANIWSINSIAAVCWPLNFIERKSGEYMDKLQIIVTAVTAIIPAITSYFVAQYQGKIWLGVSFYRC